MAEEDYVFYAALAEKVMDDEKLREGRSSETVREMSGSDLQGRGDRECVCWGY